MIRVVLLALWGATTLMGAVAITQALGYDGPLVLVGLQTLTPFVLGGALPVAAAGVVARRPVLVGVNAGIVVALLVLVAPVVFAQRAPSVPSDLPRLRVLEVNFKFDTGPPEAKAHDIAAAGADVMVLIEITPGQERALQEAAGSTYPYRVARAAELARGVAIWSRVPISDGAITVVGPHPAARAVIAGITVWAVHPYPPTVDRANWRRGLRAIAQLPVSGPTMVVGDFNGARWHPQFRDVLAHGWRDAHEWLGHGFSGSWPNNKRWGPVVRFDHALLKGGVVPVAVRELDVTNSDHRGFVVTVAVAP